MISPTSLPFLASECTQQPASSSSGCSSTPLIAATPTDPVAHCTTRRLIVGLGSVSPFADLVRVFGVPAPDGLLVVLAHAGARNLIDECPTLGQPPANDFVGQELS